MDKHRKFLLGNQVKYTGKRLSRLNRKNVAWGEVVGYVKGGTEFSCVVEFDSGSYIVYDSELDYYNHTEKETTTIDVVKITRKWDEV